jgi:hypothetical protein
MRRLIRTALMLISGPGYCSESTLFVATAALNCPKPSIGGCRNLHCDRRQARPTVEETDTQSPPDSRMNRPSEHFHRLSLGSLLSSISLVTRPARATFHYLVLSLYASAYCDNCMYQDLFVSLRLRTSHSSLAGALHVVAEPSDSASHCHSASTASVLESSNFETPSSWPAPSIPAAIRCVSPRMSACSVLFVRSPPGAVGCCLHPPQIPSSRLLTSVRGQSDSSRPYFGAGENLLSSEQLLAQYSQGLGNGPLSAAFAAKFSSMSGYGKNQEQYVYGKYVAVHLIVVVGRCHGLCMCG